MRTLKLLGAAAQAEQYRLGRKAHSVVRKIVYSVAGAVFLCWALGFGEYAGYCALAASLKPPVAALIAAAVNIAIAVLFLVIAAHRSRYDREAAELKVMRDSVFAEIQNSLTVGLLIKRFLGSIGGDSMSAVALASVVSKFFKGTRAVVLIGSLGAAAALQIAPAHAAEPPPAVQPAAPPAVASPPVTNETPRVNGTGAPTAPPERVGGADRSASPQGQAASPVKP